jgi:hypothetical protein
MIEFCCFGFKRGRIAHVRSAEFMMCRFWLIEIRMAQTVKWQLNRGIKQKIRLWRDEFLNISFIKA